MKTARNLKTDDHLARWRTGGVRYLGIAAVIALGCAFAGKAVGADSADQARVELERLVESMPGQVVQPLPGQAAHSLPGQIVQSLPGQMVRALPGQVVQPLPGEMIRPLPSQIVRSLAGQTAQPLPSKAILRSRPQSAALSKHGG